MESSAVEAFVAPTGFSLSYLAPVANSRVGLSLMNDMMHMNSSGRGDAVVKSAIRRSDGTFALAVLDHPF